MFLIFVITRLYLLYFFRTLNSKEISFGDCECLQLKGNRKLDYSIVIQQVSV